MPKARRFTSSAAQLCLFPIDAEEADLLPDSLVAEPAADINTPVTVASHQNAAADPQAQPIAQLVSIQTGDSPSDGPGTSPIEPLPRITRSHPFRRTSNFDRDFRITDAHRIGCGGLKQKLADNLEAIRTLKAIEAEDRPATIEEQTRLVRYCGWGALPQLFEPNPREEWKAAAGELTKLLSPEEFACARASTPNAHYTSVELIRFLWDSLERLGFTGGHILEPACGIGHFFGLMPEHLLSASRRTGVEIDTISARIAQKLYPCSSILESAFEQAPLPDHFYDAVIGNVPFGNVPVYDPAYRRQPALTKSLHDYFLVKSLDKVRPGGLIALITSFYSMDKREAAVRRHLAERAALIAAYRLPNSAFLSNAGTKATTDILFLQKH